MALDFIAGYVLGSRQAARASGLAASAAQFSSSSSRRTDDLTDRFERLTLVVQAMWAMLEADGHTQEELIAAIQELDLADGDEDGRRIEPPVDCTGCGAKVGRGLAACQFCGTEVAEADPFAL